MGKFYNYNNNNYNRASDLKIKNLEANLNKAKDIAELGAKAIESPYISILFDSQQNFAEILKGTPILTQIYKNVQGLVLYSKGQKEENLKLNDRIKELVAKAGDNDSDKNIIAKLRESMSLLEKEKIQLNGKINELKSNNAKQEEEMKALKSKFNDCNVKMIEKARENSADQNTISELRESMSLLGKENIHLNEKLHIFENSNKEQKQQLLILYSQLNDCVKELIEKDAERITDKNVITDLRGSMLSHEKEKNQLNEEIMNLQSKNEKQQKLMKSLYLEGEAAKSKIRGMKKLEEECKAMATTIKNFVTIKKYLEDTAFNANKIAEEAYEDSEKLQQAVEDLSNDKAQLEERCVNALFEIEERKKYESILEITVQAADEKIHNLSQSEKALKDQIEELDSEKLQQAIEDLSNDKAQLEERCVNALFEIEERKKYESILEITVQAADEKIHNLSQSEKALKDQSKELHKRLHQSINDKKQSDEEKEQLCINENRLKKYNEEIEKNLKCQKDENAYLKQSLVNHVQKIASLEANIEGLKTNVKEKESFLETNIKLTVELNSIKSIAADLETRNERQAGELKRLCESNERVAALFKKSRIEADDPQNTVSASTEPCKGDSH